MTKTLKAPKHCAYCGKPAVKKTEEKYNPLRGGDLHEAQREKRRAWDYQGNMIVVMRRRFQDYISSVIVWDNETWTLRYDPFCTLNCAAAFAHAAYRGGFRMVQKGAKS